MRKHHFIHTALLLTVFAVSSCNAGAKKASENTERPAIPVFHADSAYQYVKNQTLFGPRVPNTDAHEACRSYLVSFLKRCGATVTEQPAELSIYDGTVFKATNIIASFHPRNSNRILLCAHWDSRPWADNDPNKNNHHNPVMGANDGASGVGVLMEIARQIGLEAIKNNLPQTGIDIVFFDAEDCGEPNFFEGPKKEESWCLGTQYWAKHPHKSGYNARYGILLDMVGGKAPNFLWEHYSTQYAPHVLENVWKKAAELGYGNYFRSEKGGAITDDHLFINKMTGIPCIDLIDYDPFSSTGFVPYWHTTDDTMRHIDTFTLEMVGRTLLSVIFSK